MIIRVDRGANGKLVGRVGSATRYAPVRPRAMAEEKPMPSEFKVNVHHTNARVAAPFGSATLLSFGGDAARDRAIVALLRKLGLWRMTKLLSRAWVARLRGQAPKGASPPRDAEESPNARH